MAPMRSPPAASRTTPTKLTMPPISCRSSVSRVISAPTSKSSRWTRIISASRDRREQRNLVARAHGVVPGHVVLIDRDAHHRRVLQRVGKARAAALQPRQQIANGLDAGGEFDSLLGRPDLDAEPSEIEELHGWGFLVLT